MAFGALVFIAQYLQLVLGLSPLHAGLWTTPFAGAFIVGSMLTPVIARRLRPEYVMVGGLALSAVGFGVLTQVGGPSGLAVLVTGFVVYSLGLAPVFTLATDMIIGSAPPERAGAASAISETGSELGGALGIRIEALNANGRPLGIAILGSIGTAVYRSGMAEAVLAGVSPEAAEAARGTLGGALAVAGRMPDHLGAELINTARSAFAQALELSALISVVLVVATAIVAALLLRTRELKLRAQPEDA